MNRHRLSPAGAALACLAVVAAVLAGCGSSSSTGSGSDSGGKTTPIRMVLDWTPNTNHTGIYVAQQEGWYKDAGLDVKISQPGQDSTSLQELGAGRADVVVTTEEEVTAARAQGIPVVSIAAIIQHNTSSLVALKKSGIKTIADLPGHTYGGYGGPLETALVDKLTECGGGDPKQVKTVEVGDADYRVGMERGDYDFVWIFDGWDGIRYKDIDKLDLTTIPFSEHTDCIPDWYTPVLATSEKELKEQPEQLKAFMDATSRGYQLAMSDPKKAADLLIKAVPEIDPQLVKLSADYLSTRYADDPAKWGHQDLATWTKMTAFIKDAGMTKKDIDPKEAFTNDLLPKGAS